MKAEMKVEIVLTLRGLTYRRQALTSDMYDFCEPVVPDVVIDSVWHAFPHTWQNVLREMRWSAFERLWFIPICGQTVGIEVDGYVHS